MKSRLYNGLEISGLNEYGLEEELAATNRDLFIARRAKDKQTVEYYINHLRALEIHRNQLVRG